MQFFISCSGIVNKFINKYFELKFEEIYNIKVSYGCKASRTKYFTQIFSSGIK